MYTKKFQEVSIQDVATVGGKGASLGEMNKAGFPVPQGFVITTKAYEDFNNRSFSEVFAKELLQAFEDLKTDRVAVRSSAIAEDSVNASWAGQLESYLNVTKKDLFQNIKNCWDSINSKKAAYYAKNKKLEKNQLSVAVIVQVMVESEMAGVMFTINPINNNKNEMVIEAGFGLGELVVQGRITPDNYIFDKKTLKIKNKTTGDQQEMFVYSDGKNKTVYLPKELVGAFALDEDQIRELSQLGQLIEKHYGFPCDIEWAYEKRKFYIVQSRPITAHVSFTSAKQRTNISEWDADSIFRWGPIPGKIFYISDYVEAAARLKKYLGRGFPETLLLFSEGQMVWLCSQNEMIDTGAEIFNKYVLPKNSTANWHTQFEKATKELEKFQSQLSVDNLSRIELSNVLEKFYKLIINFWLPTIPAEIGNYGSPVVLRHNLSKIIKNDKDLDHALQILTAPEELSYNQHEEIELADTDNLDKHLKRYFWMQNNYSGSKSLDVQFFAERKEKLEENIEKNAQQKIEELKNEKRNLINKYDLPTETTKIADIIWQNIIWQDTRKKLSLKTFFYKSLLLEKAAIYLNREKSELENCFYIEIIKALNENVLIKKTDPEYTGVRIGQDVWKLLAGKEAEIAWKIYAKPQVTNQDKNYLSGIVASRGKQNPLIAKAKIITNPDDINDFPRGSVLVAAMTSPEYTILMRKASAVVTDTGGLTSHAAIVSREIGVPCIVGTKFATQLIKDGDIVKIDTDTGSVIKL